MSSAGARSAGVGDEFRLYDLTVSAGGPTGARRPLLRVTPPTFDPPHARRKPPTTDRDSRFFAVIRRLTPSSARFGHIGEWH